MYPIGSKTGSPYTIAVGTCERAEAYTRRGIDNAKSAVSARNAAKNAAGHWLRLKAGLRPKILKPLA